MDCNVERRRTRSGRLATQIVLLPDADRSDPDNDSSSDEDIPLAHYSKKKLVNENSSSSEIEDGSSSSDDDIPLSNYCAKTKTAQKSVGPNRKTERAFRWRKAKQPLQRDMNWKSSLSDPPAEIPKPIEYFHKYFTHELIQHTVDQTNFYAVQSGSSFRTDRDEIEKYLGILVKMGIVHMPRYRMYWATETRFAPVAGVMSRNRFAELQKFIHFNDNLLVVTDRDDPLYDRYFKVRPMLTMLRDACLQTEPEEKMSVDEQMIPYKGKNSLRQYLPKKPKKWGFKAIARCGVSGLTYDFLLYDGSCPSVSESCGYQPGDFVIKLCETLPIDKNFKVYFDNWFTFLELHIQLQKSGIWSVGTIRSNRTRGCDLKSEKELKKEGRGSSDYRVDANSGLHVVRWMDSSAVQLSSTHVGIEPMSKINRWDRKQRKYVEIDCPAIVKEYNEHIYGWG